MEKIKKPIKAPEETATKHTPDNVPGYKHFKKSHYPEGKH